MSAFLVVCLFVAFSAAQIPDGYMVDPGLAPPHHDTVANNVTIANATSVHTPGNAAEADHETKPEDTHNEHSNTTVNTTTSVHTPDNPAAAETVKNITTVQPLETQKPTDPPKKDDFLSTTSKPSSSNTTLEPKTTPFPSSSMAASVNVFVGVVCFFALHIFT